MTVSDRAEIWGEVVSCLRCAQGLRLVGLLPTTFTPRQIGTSGAEVVILDCASEESAGIKLLQQFTTELPVFRAVLVVDKVERQFVYEAIKHGARAVFVRPLAADELGPAIPVVAGGGLCLSGQAAKLLFGNESRSLWQQAPEGGDLTPREREILRLQAEGLGYKQIAARLSLSEHTVSNHLYSVRQKLGVHTAIEAINRVMHSKSSASAGGVDNPSGA